MTDFLALGNLVVNFDSEIKYLFFNKLAGRFKVCPSPFQFKK
jgi:hypothetical protein